MGAAVQWMSLGLLIATAGCSASEGATAPSKGIYDRSVRCLAALENLAEVFGRGGEADPRLIAAKAHMLGVMQAGAELNGVSLREAENAVRTARSQPDLRLDPNTGPFDNDQRVARICRGVLPNVESEIDLPPLMSNEKSNEPVVVQPAQQPMKR